MNNLILTNEQLEFKMYQLQEDYYKNKLTTIGA